MSAGPIKAAQWVSNRILEVATPFYQPKTATIRSCPAAFGLWQVVGSWLACMTVYAADLARRRAFLRTKKAASLLGPQYAAAALRWPFGRTSVVVDCLLLLLLVSLAHCVIWAITLDVLG
jgi:hypothetical protein